MFSFLIVWGGGGSSMSLRVSMRLLGFEVVVLSAALIANLHRTVWVYGVWGLLAGSGHIASRG